MKTNKGWPKGYNGYPHNADSAFRINKIEQQRNKKDAMDKFANSQNAKAFPEFLKKMANLKPTNKSLKI